MEYKNFNSHAHVERDDSERQYIVNMLHFNSHAHVERDLTEYRVQQLEKHFNSHAHVERDYVCTKHFVNFFISTHTLTWSVTYDEQINIKTTSISTHTLTWSVTQSSAVTW